MAIRVARPHRLPRSVDFSDVRIEASRRRSDCAISRFWKWWAAEGADACARAVEAGDVESVVPEITSHIEAVDPGLAWEFGPALREPDEGSPRPHQLTVTAAGAPELRGVARRWLARAPRQCAAWAYSDLRDPVEGSAMWFRGQRLGFDEAEIVIEAGLSLTDISVHHPAFHALDAEDRSVAAYLLLDAVAGEAAVETWVGRIDACATPPIALSVPLHDLPEVLRKLEEDNMDELGDPAWQILQADTGRGPMMAMVRTPLVALSAPQFDQHVVIDVEYSDQGEYGLPGQGSLALLRDLEDHLGERIRGSGECVVAESCDGRRRLHFYVDSTTPAVEQLRVAMGGWDQGPVEMEVNDDPGWSRVQHLRV